eukprot:6089381-Pyramimonas_sp.AAC.1
MVPHLRAKSGSIAALGPEARNELKARQLQRSAETALQKPRRTPHRGNAMSVTSRKRDGKAWRKS